MACTPPYEGMACYYAEAGYYYNATVHAVVSGNTVNLNVSVLGMRYNIAYSMCFQHNRWTCKPLNPGCTTANWSSGSDARIKVPA